MEFLPYKLINLMLKGITLQNKHLYKEDVFVLMERGLDWE